MGKKSIIALEDAHSCKYGEHKTVIHYGKDENHAAGDVIRGISNLARTKKGIEAGKLHFVRSVDSIDIKTGFFCGVLERRRKG